MKVGRLKAYLEAVIDDLSKLPEDADLVEHDTNKGLGDYVKFKYEGFFDINQIEIVHHDRLLKIHDVELDININDERDDKLMTFEELHDLAIKHVVIVKIENRQNELGFPTFGFEGMECNLIELLKELEFYEDDIEYMMKTAEEA